MTTRWLRALVLGAMTMLAQAMELQSFVAGIRVAPGVAVEFSGRLNLDQGPEDGLEVLASLHAEKLHESLIELDTRDAPSVLAALLLVFGDQADQVPGQARVEIAWQVGGVTVTHPAETLVRDRHSDAALPLGDVRWRGVVRADYQQTTAGGGPAVHRLPVLGQTGTVVAVFDEEHGAPLHLPVPDPEDDRRYEANSRILPPIGTPVVVRVSLGQLP